MTRSIPRRHRETRVDMIDRTIRQELEHGRLIEVPEVAVDRVVAIDHGAAAIVGAGAESGRSDRRPDEVSPGRDVAEVLT